MNAPHPPDSRACPALPLLKRPCVRATAAIAGMLWATAAGAVVPDPDFYLPFDGGDTAAIARGAREPVRQRIADADTILELLTRQRVRFVPGRVGQGIDLGDQPLVYECAGNFRADEGTAAFWVNPDWPGDSKTVYSTLFGAANWGMVYKYENQSSLTFGTARPEKDLYYDCGGGDLRAWRPGQWHHVAVSWSRQQNVRRLYIDGAPIRSGPFPFARAVTNGPLFVGAGCTLYPGLTAHAKFDEFALWSRPLDAAAIGELFALGQAGRPLRDVPQDAQDARGGAFRPTTGRAPVPPEPNDPQTTRSGPRTQVSLNGWWSLLPAARELKALPAAGWGLSRVPGYWTDPRARRAPDGRAGGAWPPTAAGWCMAYHQRSFTADPAWKPRRVLLQLDGVDGLAQVFVNDTPLGWLGAWEPESYDIGSLLRYGDTNTVTIALHTRGGSLKAGIYGDVRLCVLPGAMLHDVTLRPLTETGGLEVNFGVWNPGSARDATLEVEVRAKTDPARIVRQFVHACTLTSAGKSPAILGQLQRVARTFEWPDAHRWAPDDPFLYAFTARLREGDAVVDELPAQRFGFREFALRGGDFLLNGKPFHLRGHQIDLGWSDQMDRVVELKAAGMNALELSGPISSSWYSAAPYRKQLFENILDYCDEHGLIALPILPDPPVLRDRIFDPEVAALYRQRVEKHIRTYSNHACVGMWYMDFNLACYPWYVAPTKLDGSYKPDEVRHQTRERFALEAQRIAQSIDPRPLYHHACGNFGDIFTANLYLGPNSPTQEREEWPSAWAAKRPFPFMACEHCCMLIPYWFRPRQFPLSVVYAGEPIFDEISAMYLGPQAYQKATPEVFDLYDIGRTPRGTRTRALIRHHAGYQETKAQVARHSLRAWRTWGVPGIIFNAENWDFKDDDGNPLPMMKAVARYFGDTDLYLAGPGDDWPSKDHSFRSGETIRKQAVLLNDLTRDIPVELAWTLRDAAGREAGAGRVAAVSKAGIPTFIPIECAAPVVTQRTECVLTIGPAPGTGADATVFASESFPLQVFPPCPAMAADVVIHDPAGETTRLLQQAGVRCTPLTAGTRLALGTPLVVGRKSYDDTFAALARSLNLDRAIREGLRVLVFEQTAGSPFGLTLEETSVRQTYPAIPDHPLLRGLEAPDVQDLRGESDLIAAYPDADPTTRTNWPARCFKWGNRGVVATYVYRKPHYSPFRPVLECGFDLVQSPLLEARLGKGSVTLCQVDVTPRHGTDPVSTLLVANLLRTLAGPADGPQKSCRYVGASAVRFAERFGIRPQPFSPGSRGVILVGREPLDAVQAGQLEQAARDGSTVVLLPGAAVSAFGLATREASFFAATPKSNRLVDGLNAGDFFLKSMTRAPCGLEQDGWRNLTSPGILSVKVAGAGSIVACSLDPEALGPTRARIKALRVWNALLTNLQIERDSATVVSPPPPYEDNEWERLPPYINW